MTEPLRLTFDVACSPEHAFEVWAARTSLWWPPDHTVSGDAGATVTIEPRAGGRIFERTPAGVEHDWGEVVDFQPPHRLAYRWHIGADRAEATDVEITFRGGPATTTVTIVHSGFQRLGDAAAARRERNQAGWAGLLPHYRQAAAG